MNKNALLKDVMTNKVIVANVYNSFTQVMEFFNTWRIQHLPVTDGDKLIGICSINDLLSFMYKHLSSGNTVDFKSLDEKFHMNEVMTKNPVTLTSFDTVREAYRLLSDGKFQALPIIDQGKLVGIVTNKDLVKFTAQS